MSPALTVERIGPGGTVARLTLSRPDIHNAFDAALIGELRATFAALAREGPTELRAVILRGDGPSFCAGADVAWMRAAAKLDVEANEQDAMAMADVFRPRHLSCPVIARVTARRSVAASAVRGRRRGDRQQRPVRVHGDAPGILPP
jgi:methylglutaconyl-CoA hydratase